MSYPVSISVHEQDLKEFCSIYANAQKVAKKLGVKNYGYDFEGDHRMSFDKNWRPFIGESRGYNYEHQRFYMDSCEISDRIAEVLMPIKWAEGFDGGRVLMSDSRVCIKSGHQKIQIIRWKPYYGGVLKMGDFRILSRLKFQSAY